jgi:hypothetical protein
MISSQIDYSITCHQYQMNLWGMKISHFLMSVVLSPNLIASAKLLIISSACVPNKCAPKIRPPVEVLLPPLLAFSFRSSINTLNPEYLSPILRDEYQL